MTGTSLDLCPRDNCRGLLNVIAPASYKRELLNCNRCGARYELDLTPNPQRPAIDKSQDVIAITNDHRYGRHDDAANPKCMACTSTFGK